MRFVIAAVLAAGFATSMAHADQFIDPNGRISFETPAGWLVGPQRAEGYSYIVTAGPNDECHLVAVPRAETAESPPDLLRTASANAVESATWTGVAHAMNQVVRGEPTIASQSVDQTRFWPIQRAELTTNGGQRVFGAIQYRPGVELWALCSSYNAASSSAASFDALLQSIGTPNDAALQAEAEQLAESRERGNSLELMSETERQRNMGSSLTRREVPTGVMQGSGPSAN